VQILTLRKTISQHSQQVIYRITVCFWWLCPAKRKLYPSCISNSNTDWTTFSYPSSLSLFFVPSVISVPTSVMSFHVTKPHGTNSRPTSHKTTRYIPCQPFPKNHMTHIKPHLNFEQNLPVKSSGTICYTTWHIYHKSCNQTASQKFESNFPGKPREKTLSKT